MSEAAEFHDLDDVKGGIVRELADGMSVRIFAGDQAMLSIVTIAPNSTGVVHHHFEEQRDVLLEGSGVCVQGGEQIEVRKGNFLRTPGNVPHTFRAGLQGARVLDIFSPPREEHKRAGKGFA